MQFPFISISPAHWKIIQVNTLSPHRFRFPNHSSSHRHQSEAKLLMTVRLRENTRSVYCCSIKERRLQFCRVDSISAYRSAAGNRVFAGRRWLDPADAADRAHLATGYDRLAEAFPDFPAACPRDRFLQALADASASSPRRLKRPRRSLAERAPPTQLLVPLGGAAAPLAAGTSEAEAKAGSIRRRTSRRPRSGTAPAAKNAVTRATKAAKASTNCCW